MPITFTYHNLQQGLDYCRNNNSTSAFTNIFLIAARNAIFNSIKRNLSEFYIISNPPDIIRNPEETDAGYRNRRGSEIYAWMQNNGHRSQAKPCVNAFLNMLRGLDINAMQLAESSLSQILTGEDQYDFLPILHRFNINSANEDIKLTLYNFHLTARELENVIIQDHNNRFISLHFVTNAQSTMTAGVDQSVQRSVRNLLSRYQAAVINNVEQLISAITNFITQDPGHNLYHRAMAGLYSTHINASTTSIPSQHECLAINIRQVLALIWFAINDRNCVIGINNEILENNENNAATINSTILTRKNNLRNALAEFATEYQGNNNAYSVIACAHGTYNKIVETLNMAHPDVLIYAGNDVLIRDSAIRHAQNILTSIFSCMSPAEQADLNTAWNTNEPTYHQIQQCHRFIDSIIDNFRVLVNQQLHADFPQTSDSNNITNIINALFGSKSTSIIWDLNLVAPNLSSTNSNNAANAANFANRNVDNVAPATQHNNQTGNILPEMRANNFDASASGMSTVLQLSRVTTIVGGNLEAFPDSQLTLNRLITSNVNIVNVYRNELALPNIPIICPYHPTGGLQYNERIDNGRPRFSLACKLSNNAIDNLPAGARQFLAAHNINFSRVECCIALQNQPWRAENLLFRPHAWLVRNDNGNYNMNYEISVSIAAVGSKFTSYAVVNIDIHPDHNGQVVFSPINMSFRGLADHNVTSQFYSICIVPSQQRAAVTYHGLLSDGDQHILEDLITALVPQAENNTVRVGDFLTALAQTNTTINTTELSKFISGNRNLEAEAQYGESNIIIIEQNRSITNQQNQNSQFVRSRPLHTLAYAPTPNQQVTPLNAWQFNFAAEAARRAAEEAARRAAEEEQRQRREVEVVVATAQINARAFLAKRKR